MTGDLDSISAVQGKQRRLAAEKRGVMAFSAHRVKREAVNKPFLLNTIRR